VLVALQKTQGSLPAGVTDQIHIRLPESPELHGKQFQYKWVVIYQQNFHHRSIHTLGFASKRRLVAALQRPRGCGGSS
jgi:hypothetical protein